MTRAITRAGLGTLLALGLLAAPAAFAAEQGKTSGEAAGNTPEPSSKGAGSADKAMQEGPGSADKTKQHGSSHK